MTAATLNAPEKAEKFFAEKLAFTTLADGSEPAD